MHVQDLPNTRFLDHEYPMHALAQHSYASASGILLASRRCHIYGVATGMLIMHDCQQPAQPMFDQCMGLALLRAITLSVSAGMGSDCTCLHLHLHSQEAA